MFPYIYFYYFFYTRTPIPEALDLSFRQNKHKMTYQMRMVQQILNVHVF